MSYSVKLEHAIRVVENMPADYARDFDRHVIIRMMPNGRYIRPSSSPILCVPLPRATMATTT